MKRWWLIIIKLACPPCAESGAGLTPVHEFFAKAEYDERGDLGWEQVQSALEAIKKIKLRVSFYEGCLKFVREKHQNAAGVNDRKRSFTAE